MTRVTPAPHVFRTGPVGARPGPPVASPGSAARFRTDARAARL
ncbi:hypothetical protein DFJ69_0738 [Thermomonospora umbrina]|uniref:Uncharacterized protein n=1 Tax=Thermomonospora umbrina TaxID=111806 RepID=A0A3D9SHI4_9ACTN|nr:hypothetical protein DFJ69_0738 [Thermomonospora umbrina]